MTSFQDRIREAEDSPEPEANCSMDLRIEIKTFGKPSSLWKIALRLSRHIHVIFGTSVVFMTLGNDELTDVPDEHDEDKIAHASNGKAGVGELGG